MTTNKNIRQSIRYIEDDIGWLEEIFSYIFEQLKEIKKHPYGHMVNLNEIISLLDHLFRDKLDAVLSSFQAKEDLSIDECRNLAQLIQEFESLYDFHKSQLSIRYEDHEEKVMKCDSLR